MEIQKEVAKLWFEKYLRKTKGYIPKHIQFIGDDVVDEKTGDKRKKRIYYLYEGKPNYFFMRKQDPYYTYGNKRYNWDETGESINRKHMQICNKENQKVELIFVMYPDGELYSITPKKFLETGWLHNNDFEDKEIWSTALKHFTKVGNISKLLKE